MSDKTRELQAEISVSCAVSPHAFIPSNATEAERAAAEERAIRVRQEGETTLAAQLEAVMARLSARFRAETLPTDAQVADYDWKTTVAPHLASLGLGDRHIRRIAPQWGNPSQERVFREVAGLCNRSGAVVALIGSRGTGKTTIAAQLMLARLEARRAHFRKPADERELFDPPEPGRYVKLGELGGMFKALYADFGTIERDALAERLKAWIDLELLVIDEIHESEDLKTHARLLVDLVDHRYARRHDTILISNHDGPEFARVINPSILSRIGEHGRILECRWESFRTGRK